jgi:glycosyltransferase involved in cell wall biosynthesis
MPHGSYVLHVGSNQIRKNREAVLRVFAKIALGTDLYVVFAGEALSQELLALGNLLGINDRMIQITNPSDLELEALYSSAAAFLFPSRFEGFGWPLIEAQACGCPVVASDIAPFREVLMNSALLFPIDRENDMAAGLLRLIVDKEFWHEIQQRGYENVKTRFTTSRMIDDYLALYKEIACRN